MELSHQPRAGPPLHRGRTRRFVCRDLVAELRITERHAFAIVTDLADAGYIVKLREGRRNRYLIQSHLALPELPDRHHAIGDVLDILTGGGAKLRPTRRTPDAADAPGLSNPK